ncbi:CoA transferase [Actinomadura fibrosa]|uniref:CoA transferase n=1 Tax=Actinomadura fibrosa TaxID=111802 RepID=A0ABW2XLA0_9ACTN|nr:CoA transferase [Actinomadura fibrosa]
MSRAEAQAAWAASGAVALTGRPGGPPLVPPGRGALLARQLAEIFADRAGARLPLDGSRLLSERAAFTGHRRRGTVSAGGACRLLPTADGWAAVSCARPDDPALLGALTGTGAAIGDPWPDVTAWLREHTGAELAERAELLGVAAGPVRPPAVPRPLPEPLPPRPVAGLLVADFSALWAGPLCAHLLGLAGARVVKVETPGRPDGARRGDPGFYRLLHAGHRSVVLDPAAPGGRRAMAALVDAADIVVEASRPRALARFGLDAEAAAAAGGTTWISITAYGRDDGRIGFGDDVAAASGLVRREPDGTPLFCGDAVADPLTGLVAAVLAASAPIAGGAVWDVAMADVVAATLDQEDGTPPPAAVPCGDGWAVETEDGTVPVAEPVRREAAGTAPEPGRDTADVLGELGIPVP